MSPDLESLGSVPRAIAGVALLLTAAYGAGGLVVTAPGPRPGKWLDTALIRIAVGLNLVAWCGVVLGQLRWLRGSSSLALLVGLSLLNLREVWQLKLATALRGAEVGWRWRVEFPCWRYGLVAVGVLFITLGPALSYPAGWDELVYHIVLPRRWLRDGWPACYVDLPYAGFPSLGEILFWLMAPVECCIAPRLLSWVCWILAAGMLYRVLCRTVHRSAAAVMTMAFWLSPAALLISANCYVETILLLNVAAIFLGVGRGKQWCVDFPRWRVGLVLGVLAGGAAAVKLTGIAVLAVPVLWYLATACRRPRARPAGLEISLYLTAALAVAVPFYLRPWLATGNPFYPYYAEWFTRELATLEMSRYHHALGGAAFGVRGVAAFVTGPILLAFSGANYDGTFGWQLLLLLLLAVIGAAGALRRRGRAIWWPMAGTVWLYTFWFLTAQQARFAVPTILVLVQVAALGVQRIHGSWRRAALAVMLAATLVSIPWRTAGYYVESWLFAIGRLAVRDYVGAGTGLDYLALVETLRERRFEGAKLMLLFEHRGLYMPRPQVVGTPFFQEAGFTPPERFGTSQSIMELLAREEITHLVMTKALTGPDRPAAWADRLAPFFRGVEECSRQGKLSVVWESERYVILERQ